jgi:competence protein ComEC
VNGGLLFSTRNGRRFAREVWTREDAQWDSRLWADDPAWVTRHQAICDDLGCFMQLKAVEDRAPIRIALVEELAALTEDCRRADILITRLPVDQSRCSGPMVIDGASLAARGAVAIHFHWDAVGAFKPEVAYASQGRGQRPWNILN